MPHLSTREKEQLKKAKVLVKILSRLLASESFPDWVLKEINEYEKKLLTLEIKFEDGTIN